MNHNSDKHCIPQHFSSSPSTSSPIMLKSQSANALSQLLPLPSSHGSSAHPFVHNDILHVNVGGRVFTTTKNTMIKCGLFHKLLSRKEKKPSSEGEQKSESVKRQTTFENYCVEHLANNNKKNTASESTDGVYEIHSNYYFVDRSPSKFDDILSFLRDYPAVNAQQFIDRYYGCNPQQKIVRRNSLSSSLSVSSVSSSTTDQNLNLLKLQDEARFYEIDPLIHTIQEKLEEFNHNMYGSHEDDGCDKYKWWDQSGPLKGLRRLSGTRIAFATSMDNWVDIESTFEVPSGFRWATQAEYLEEYYSKKEALSTLKEWIHFGIGRWENYRWKYATKTAFIFKDTFKSQRFVHSGMEVCDINHVKSLNGYMAESPLMEYDDHKGIIEGFAGLVLISDDIWSESPASDTDTWTSDEDDEQIQSLKNMRKQLASANKKNHCNNNNNNNHSKLIRTAPICIPQLPPPQLANTFAEYTKKQRAALTKNNLMEQETHNTLMPTIHHSQSPQFFHQLRHYNYSGPLPPIPAPQLTQRLSVNSLPVKTTNHNLLMHHHQRQNQ